MDSDRANWLAAYAENGGREMTLTKAGPICDVCGKFILLDNYDTFTQKGVNATLHCHVPDCKQAIIDADGDWAKLPPGPLRDMFTERWLEDEKQRRLPGVR